MDAGVVKSVLSSAIQQPPKDQDISSTTGYTIGVLIDYLERTGSPANILAQYEFAFFRLIEHHRGARALNKALASEPSLFVELNKRIYRARSEVKRELDEEARALASQTWWVLNSWHGFPGRQPDGSLDGAAMLDWVRVARLAFAEADRGDIGDEVIGQAFARSPSGSDGYWPAEPVRDLIDMFGSREFENGLIIGKFNSRGVTTRGAYDGGAQERTLAGEFRGGSNAMKCGGLELPEYCAN